VSKELAKHVSPDGLLTFVILSEGDEISLGFEGCKSHTHGDILSRLSGKPLELAVTEYVNALLSNRAIVAVRTLRGSIDDMWICEDPNQPDPYKPDDEVTTFRLWDGTPWHP
jgi:hypothetical protein